MSSGGKSSQSGHANDAKIDELQRPAAFENDIVRLDVAVDDAGAMQRGHAPREPDRDRASLFEPYGRAPREARLEKLALDKAA